MNKVLKATLLVVVLLFATACSDHQSDHVHDGDDKAKNKVYYTCSMHPHIREDKPGKCPICHMNLTKIEVDDATEQHKQQETKKRPESQTYYTCSMHPHIREDKPGKCPICYMNLTKIEVDEPEQHKKHETKKRPESQTYYTCSMHPHIREDKPGKCPICHMNLTKVEVDEPEAIDHSQMNHSSDNQESASDVVARVKLRKAQLKHFNPDYFPVTTMKMTKKIRLLGSVLQSEEKESNIPARIGGRVEKVYVKSTGSIVHVGDPVVDLYSPKLITAGEEYLLAKRSYLKSKTKEFKGMLSQSIEKLNLWGIKKFQYKRWYKLGKVPKQITIYSNTTGIVRKRNATVGKYFKEGQNFFELSDLSDVWIEMDVYEHEASLVKIGQQVDLEFSAIPGEILMGKIDFIYPVLDSRSRTLKVRTTIENKEALLKPGMVAIAVLTIDIKGMPLVVPRTAVIDTGKRKVVWVKVNDKNFQAKTIHTGYESEGYVEIKHGLMEGEMVVIEGNFLLDAQAQLFGGYEDMKSDGSQHNH